MVSRHTEKLCRQGYESTEVRTRFTLLAPKFVSVMRGEREVGLLNGAFHVLIWHHFRDWSMLQVKSAATWGFFLIRANSHISNDRESS